MPWLHTFHRSLGNGTDSAVAMVRRSVLVHTETGMVDPSDVCGGNQQSRALNADHSLAQPS